MGNGVAFDLEGSPAGTAATAVSPPGSRTGRGFRIRVLTSVKTVVLAPIPRARVATAKATKTGVRRIERTA